LFYVSLQLNLKRYLIKIEPDGSLIKDVAKYEYNSFIIINFVYVSLQLNLKRYLIIKIEPDGSFAILQFDVNEIIKNVIKSN